MAIVIKHLSLPGPAYYGGPFVGWTTTIGLAVTYASNVAAQVQIDLHRMYAEPANNPPTTTTVADWAANVVCNQSVPPGTNSATVTGASVDFNAAGGTGLCACEQNIGIVTGPGDTPTVTGHVEESNDDVTYTPIAGAVFNDVAFSNDRQIITFNRTKKYLRYVGVIVGTSPEVFIGANIYQSI